MWQISVDKLASSFYCSGDRLMGSLIIVSVRKWNQIYPNLQVPNDSVIPKPIHLLVSLG